MEAKDLRNMPEAELLEVVGQLRDEMFNARFKGVTEPITDSAGLKRKRREIARIRTVLRERELAASPRPERLTREGRRARRETAERLSARAAKKAAKGKPAPTKTEG